MNRTQHIPNQEDKLQIKLASGKNWAKIKHQQWSPLPLHQVQL